MVIRMKRNGWQNWHWKSCRRLVDSRIVATSVPGEVLHCRAIVPAHGAPQQTTDGTPARRLALRLMEFNPAKLNSVCPRVPANGVETQEKAFQLINEQHLEQLPMHEFLVRIRAQLLWPWARLDEAERRRVAGSKSCRLISDSNSFSAWQC